MCSCRWLVGVSLALVMTGAAVAENVLDRKSGGPIAGGVTEARLGNTMFEIPADWSRRPNEHFTTFGPPPTRDGKVYELRLLDGAEEEGTPKAFLTTAMKNFQDRGQVVQATPIATYDSPAGWTMAAVSATMKDEKGREQYWMFFVAKAGKRLQPFMFVANDLDHWKAAQPVVQRFVASLRFANLINLHPGDARKNIPPLTLFMVNEETDFLEWFMGVPFTQDQRQALSDMMLDGWKKADRETIDDVASVLKMAADFRALPAEKRDAVRQAALIQNYLPSWRDQAARDPACKLLVGIYDAAHKPIARGETPLTRQASDAFLETVYFVAAELEGVPHVAPTADEKDQFATKLAGVYGQVPGEQQKVIAAMPAVWAALRLTWPEMSAQQRREAIKEFGDLSPVKSLRAQLAGARQAADAQVAARGPVTPRAPEQVTPSTPASPPVAAAAAGDRNAAYLEAMRKMQQQQQTYRMLSNMSTQMHETRMTIIRNIGGQGTEYKWVYKPTYK